MCGNKQVVLRAMALLCSAAWLGCSAQTATQRRGQQSSSLAADSGSASTPSLDFGSPDASIVLAAPDAAPLALAPSCKASAHADDAKLPVCKLKAAAGSFQPKLQWSAELGNGFGPPLVANLTDDNGDGAIDLCDTPDVVVVAGFAPPDFAKGELLPKSAHLYVLDGATGKQHFMVDTAVTPQVTPAIGDLDNDGIPEIVAVKDAIQSLTTLKFGGLIAFDHTGKTLWEVPLDFMNAADQMGSFSVSLHDLDADGKVEVVIGTAVFDGATGKPKWNASDSNLNMASLAVDLDGDGKLEVVTGLQAFDAQGKLLWERKDLIQGNGPFADLVNLIGVYPMVLNLDDDPQPEIVVAAGPGIVVLEHDGKNKLDANGSPMMLKNGAGQFLDLGDFNPPTAHDFDGDGRVDIGLGARSGFTVLNRTLHDIFDYSMIDEGLTAATAFDFLGDGAAEAIYADSKNLIVFDVKDQKVVMTWPHSGSLDYPIVVDVDNDGSAEIVLVSSGVIESTANSILPTWREKSAPTVQVLSDAQDRWIPTRRIWNQANYRVTNVLEDGRIPRLEVPPHYLAQNTFRTNVQLEAGGSCVPPRPE